MAVSTTWYVPPFSNTNTRPTPLLSPYGEHNDAQVLQAAQPLTVSLCSAKVCEKWSHGILGIGRVETNNLLIRSQSALGKEIEVERVHFYGTGIKPKSSLGPFEYPTMYVSPDYKATDHLWLEVEVVEVELHQHDADVLKTSVAHFASSAGTTFPALAPYAAASTDLLTAAETLIEALKRNTTVLKAHAALVPDGWEGMPLRQGDYVLFNREVDGSEYTLGYDCQLFKQDGTSLADVDYVVFNVSANQNQGPDFPSQQAAALLTQLHADQTSGSTAGVEALTSAFQQYNVFQNLKRYNELQQKQQESPGSLTPSESALMATLAAMPELKDFISKKISTPPPAPPGGSSS